MAGTLTAANSSITLTVLSVFPIPQQLQGYATDDIFSVESVTPIETMMGVDGILSAGYAPAAKVMTIALQADSDSNAIFENWMAAQDVTKEAIQAMGVVTLPSIGRSYTCIRGFMTGYPPIATGARILQPRRYTITWQSIIAAPI